jgi:hypothetical protein
VIPAIRHGVRQRGQREPVRGDVRQSAQGLLRRPQGRRVRRGACQHSEDARGIQAEQPAERHRQPRAEKHHACRQRVQPDSGLAQRGEETGSQLQPDREHEQDQPELLHEVERRLVDGLAEVPGDEAREEDAGRAEPDAADLDATERHAGAAHERDHADRVRPSAS